LGKSRDIIHLIKFSLPKRYFRPIRRFKRQLESHRQYYEYPCVGSYWVACSKIRVEILLIQLYPHQQRICLLTTCQKKAGEPRSGALGIFGIQSRFLESIECYVFTALCLAHLASSGTKAKRTAQVNSCLNQEHRTTSKWQQ
jgi:hypothetical protein